MYKKKVAIASVLKPVNDTRMYEKFGKTLAATQQYHVNIIGFHANDYIEESNITFRPIFNFKRISFARLFCGIKFHKTLKKIKPDLVIINTHELLWPAVFYKQKHGCKLVYDIRENYFRNLIFTDSFPPVIKHILAIGVRLKEYISANKIDHFFLAEKFYSEELSFQKNRFTILENKCNFQQDSFVKREKQKHRKKILFTGTLAESTGVFGAIKLVKELHKIDSNVQLKIVGYTPQKSVLHRIEKEVKKYTFIELKGGENLVNHNEILKEISAANFGIIHYPTNKSTINCTPTKLYEYLSYELPILLNFHKEWESVCSQFDAAILIDFNNINANAILEKMNTKKFYTRGVGGLFSWQSEEKNLINIVETLIL